MYGFYCHFNNTDQNKDYGVFETCSNLSVSSETMKCRL